MFKRIKGFNKDDMKNVLLEIGERVPNEGTMVILKEKILESEQYKMDPDFVEGIFQSTIYERKRKEQLLADEENEKKLQYDLEKERKSVLKLNIELARMQEQTKSSVQNAVQDNKMDLEIVENQNNVDNMELLNREQFNSFGESTDNPVDFEMKQSIRKGPNSVFLLPEFSSILKPLLDGDFIATNEHERLSSIMKDELISFLNRENLICGEKNSLILRWNYSRLGEALASKYPKMLWDLPSQRQKRIRKKNSPIYTVFIRRLSQRRKMQRLRKASKMIVPHLQDEVAEENQISPEAALLELKSVTSEAGMYNISRVNILIKASFDLRKKEELSELPPFLMAQKCLETEVELRLDATMEELEKRMIKALKKMADVYKVPPTIEEMERLMQPLTAKRKAVNMDTDGDDYENRPGPTLLFGKTKMIQMENTIIQLDNDCGIERGAILLLGIYYVLNLSFPQAYGQFLGLLQNILIKGKGFPRAFSSNNLLNVTKNLLSVK